jgi:hypothetical protein
MPELSDTRVVALWERGQRLGAIGRALLLAGESGEIGERDPAEASIGERDAAILRLHARSFGAQLSGYTNCPRCGERLEFDFASDALLAGAASPGAREVTMEGLHFRLPDSWDLKAIAGADGIAAAERGLLRRCCLDPAAPLEWSDAFVARLEERIGALDPAADIRFTFACVACAHAWDERFDAAAWCWDRVELRAQRLLDEVHELARAYGWSEARILELGEARRRAYLERCAA